AINWRAWARTLPCGECSMVLTAARAQRPTTRNHVRRREESQEFLAMNQRLSTFVHELHADGVTHDAGQSDRLLKRRNLEPATAQLLSLIVRVARARQVVEIGTANGYSTIWLADAVGDTGGSVVSIDTATSNEARANLDRADAAQPGLATRVELRQEHGGAYLARLAEGSVDLLFLDAERVEYPRWWPHQVRVLHPGAVLAIDNVLSHADEVAPFLTLLARETALVRATIAVGKGLYLAWRGGNRDSPAARDLGTDGPATPHREEA